MLAVTDNPVDLIVAAVIFGAIILVGVGAALGWIEEHQPCDCLHCTRKRTRPTVGGYESSGRSTYDLAPPRSVPPASGKTR